MTRTATTIALSPPGWAGVGTCALPHGTEETFRLGYHLLFLATAGHGTVEVDFAAHSCRPGTLLWVRPGQALRFLNNGLNASLVTFAPPLAVEDDAAGPFLWQLEGEDEDAVISEFSQLAVDCERHRDGRVAAALLRHQLSVILLRVALLSTGDPGTEAERRTYGRFRLMLEDGLGSSRRVEDYAEKLGCSVRTLTRACLASTGRTAKQVVDDRVALEARRLLACSRLSIGEVGRSLGFPEPTNFGRFFQREVGRSPGQFRADRGIHHHGRVPEPRRPAD